MSEIKRVALNSLEPSKVSEVANKSASKTIRITVTLPESNEDKCPEYNYKDLLALTKVTYERKWLRIVLQIDLIEKSNLLQLFPAYNPVAVTVV